MPIKQYSPIGDFPPVKYLKLEDTEGSTPSSAKRGREFEDQEWKNKCPQLEEAAGLPELSSPLWPFCCFRFHPDSNGNQFFQLSDLKPGWNDLTFYSGDLDIWFVFLIWLPTGFWSRKNSILRLPKSAILAVDSISADASTSSFLQSIFEPLLEGLEEKGVSLIINGYEGSGISGVTPTETGVVFDRRSRFYVPIDPGAPEEQFFEFGLSMPDTSKNIGGQTIFITHDFVDNFLSATYIFDHNIPDSDVGGHFYEKQFYLTDALPITEYTDAIIDFWNSMIPIFDNCQLEYGLVQLAPDFNGRTEFEVFTNPDFPFFQTRYHGEENAGSYAILNSIGITTATPLNDLDQCVVTPITPTSSLGAGRRAAFNEWYNKAPAAIAAFFEIDL